MNCLGPRSPLVLMLCGWSLRVPKHPITEVSRLRRDLQLGRPDKTGRSNAASAWPRWALGLRSRTALATSFTSKFRTFSGRGDANHQVFELVLIDEAAVILPDAIIRTGAASRCGDHASRARDGQEEI
jgi:hypothetical protein